MTFKHELAVSIAIELTGKPRESIEPFISRENDYYESEDQWETEQAVSNFAEIIHDSTASKGYQYFEADLRTSCRMAMLVGKALEGVIVRKRQWREHLAEIDRQQKEWDEERAKKRCDHTSDDGEKCEERATHFMTTQERCRSHSDIEDWP